MFDIRKIQEQVIFGAVKEAFGCEVDVELLKSIKMGDGICLMKILPREPVWK